MRADAFSKMSLELLSIVLLLAAVTAVGVMHVVAAQVRDMRAVSELTSEVERLRRQYRAHLEEIERRNAGAGAAGASEELLEGGFDMVAERPRAAA